MNTEEYNNLLGELAKDETTLERKAEIVEILQNDRQDAINKHDELVSNTAKLQEDYKKLQAKKVDEFFSKGVDGNNPDDTDVTPKPEEKLPTYEEIVKDLIGGK